MTNELVPVDKGSELLAYTDTGTAAIARAVEQMAGAHKLAQALANTQFVPAHFRGKPDDVAAAIMYGAAIGMDPMASLRAIYVVNGTPGMYARQMVALVQAAGHQVWTEESTDEQVTVCGRRRGSQHIERVTWTIERATKAGYTSNRKYDTDPQAMLWARAASDVARRLAPDALAGLDTSVEELQVIQGEVVTSTTTSRESAADVLTPNTPKPEPDPDMVTKDQLKKIGALMREAGITDRNAALAYVGDVVDRQVASRNDLTRDEASRVIDALTAETAADHRTGEVPAEPKEEQ